MKASLFGVAAVGLLFGAGALAEDVKKDTEKLQGDWKVVSIEERGQTKDENEGHHIVFAKDEFSVKRGDQDIIKGKFKIDPSKSPKTIDLEITESAKADIKDKTGVGIYAVDGDTLKLCINEPGLTDRPKEFAALADTKCIFVTLKREKQ